MGGIEDKNQETPAQAAQERTSPTAERHQLSDQINQTLTPEPEKAGRLNDKYAQALEKIPQDQLEKDRATLQSADIVDIRSNHRILVPPKETEESPEEKITNVKQETERRLKAYTGNFDGKWHTLNYREMGYDRNGLSHEMNVGLGEILLDPDITDILIFSQEKGIIKAHRDFVPAGKRHAGRLGFLDENDNYVATYSGDKFMILSDHEETNVATYIEALDDENAARRDHRQDFEEEVKRDFAITTDLSDLLNDPETKTTSEQTAIEKLNRNRAEKDGAEILEYCKEVCAQFEIPFEIYKEIVTVESNWNPGLKYEGNIKSDATGFGQLMGKYTTGPDGYAKHYSTDAYDPRWGDKPRNKQEELDTRLNPYFSAWMIARKMSEIKKFYGNSLTEKPLPEQGVIYYLGYHEGVAGSKHYLQFLETMEKDGHLTMGDMRVAFLQNEDKYLDILHKNQRWRVAEYGIQHFLSVHFYIARKVGARAGAKA